VQTARFTCQSRRAAALAVRRKEAIVNRLCLLPVFIAFILAASVAWSADDKGGDKPEAKPITIEIKSLSYDPETVEIRVRDSVVWTNKAFTKHTATSDDEGKTFDTGEIKPTESSNPVKFEKDGEFKYHCKIHGKSMSGTIVVKLAEKQ
jgi:plastocyanin